MTLGEQRQHIRELEDAEQARVLRERARGALGARGSDKLSGNQHNLKPHKPISTVLCEPVEIPPFPWREVLGGVGEVLLVVAAGWIVVLVLSGLLDLFS